MRSEQEVFNDLEQLCTSSGFIYVLPYLEILHDCILSDSKEVKPSDMHCAKDMDKKIIETEMSALVGLMIKKQIDYSEPKEERLFGMFFQAHSLLDELHKILESQALKFSDIKKIIKNKSLIQPTKEWIRERTFYASQCANDFQLLDLVYEKYKNDDQWLIDNMGFSSLDMEKVLRAMWRIKQRNIGVLTSITFGFDIEEIHTESKIEIYKIRKILECFTAKEGSNANYKKIDDLNEARIRPIIQKDDTYFCFSLYALFESACESPFFWIRDKDKKYFNEEYTANRGKFVEDFSYKKLCEVFGESNVYKNVVLYKGKQTVEEIDILVIYGSRVIICQAKAKGLTLSAKQGEIKQIKKDFYNAIQKAYEQAIKCADFLQDDEIKIRDERENLIELKQEIYEIYPMCILGTPIPSLSLLIKDFLEKQESRNTRFPYILDIFLLDMMAEMLESPLFFMDFLNQRTYNHQKYMSENEIEVLGFYLATGFPEYKDYNQVVIGADLAAELDLAFSTRRVGKEIGRDEYQINGFISKFKETIFEDLIYKIQSNPDFIEFGFFLLEIGNDFIQDVEKKIRELGHRIDRKLHMNFCRVDYSVGVTIVPRKKLYRDLLIECRSRQLEANLKNWIGLSIDPDSMKIYTLLMTNGKWRCAIHPYNVVKNQASIKQNKDNQLGRNDPCPCGSGKKYKKCCLK